MVVDGGRVREKIGAEPYCGFSQSLVLAAKKRGSRGIITQAGAAGGKVLNGADVDAERAITYVKEHGHQSLAVILDTTDIRHLQRVAKSINAKHARHHGIMAKKWGDGFLVMHR